ncbi:MAG: hypothetical protein PHE50_00150 [Dehalococcoidales bacterium]|nr:hypothetical protein [Dehalococcoidales bacterium]
MEMRTRETDKYSREFWEFFGKWVAVFLFLTLLAFFCQQSKAHDEKQSDWPVRLFIESGISQYDQLPDGSLWQHSFAGYYTKQDMKSWSFRVGGEYKNFRFGYFDLGQYHTAAEASNNEACTIERRDKSCPGGTQWIYTSGGIRGITLTYNFKVFDLIRAEIGPTMNRQDFTLLPSGVHEVVYGYGYMFGIGVDGKNVYAALQRYSTNIGGSITANDGLNLPSGVGSAWAFVIGHKF